MRKTFPCTGLGRTLAVVVVVGVVAGGGLGFQFSGYVIRVIL